MPTHSNPGRASPGRRTVLRLLAGAGLTPLLWPGRNLAAAAAGSLSTPSPRKLVLVELQGGNDGLNTVVPYASPAYYAQRPTIAIARDEVIRLDDQVGLHPALRPLAPAWQAGELAVVQGLGYAEPNRSHFRSIEIWDSAQDDRHFTEGWVARIFRDHPPPASLAAEGVVFGRPYVGPLLGRERRVIVMDTAAAFARRGARLADARSVSGNPALAYILDTQAEAIAASARVMKDLARAEADEALAERLQHFPSDRFGRQCLELARLLAAGTGMAAVKMSIGSFDTHIRQPDTHARLLESLAAGLAELRGFALERGLWDDLLIVTYSEFGRRAAENKSLGTDHGAAAPHFVLGGKVKGGLLGPHPDLERLENGDVALGVDFRRLFATVAERWWALPGALPEFAGQPALPFL